MHDEIGEGLGERLIAPPQVLVTSAIQNTDAEVLSGPGELPAQRGLPDAGFAREKGNRPDPFGGVLGGRQETFQLAFSADEAEQETTRGLQPIRQWDPGRT